jgi:hypothetical protein
MLVIQNLEKTSNPFAGLISQVKDLTANQLIEYLEKMDRYDVVDDTIALMGTTSYCIINSCKAHTFFVLENDLYLASRQTNLQETKQDIPQIVTIGSVHNVFSLIFLK